MDNPQLLMDQVGDADTSPYTSRGLISKIMPIPPVDENCFEIPAGPILFVLESRHLNAKIIAEHGEKFGSTLGSDLEDDGGASLHVYGADDRLEYLRFDCFEKQPHYHYVRQSEQLNQVLMIDEVAVSPIEWTLTCVRRRLPEMLDYAGATSLASAVREDAQTVALGVEKVSNMIERVAE